MGGGYSEKFIYRRSSSQNFQHPFAARVIRSTMYMLYMECMRAHGWMLKFISRIFRMTLIVHVYVHKSWQTISPTTNQAIFCLHSGYSYTIKNIFRHDKTFYSPCLSLAGSDTTSLLSSRSCQVHEVLFNTWWTIAYQ